VGNITFGGTGPAGTVTGHCESRLAEEGGSIDLIVSQGGAGTRLAFKVRHSTEDQAGKAEEHRWPA